MFASELQSSLGNRAEILRLDEEFRQTGPLDGRLAEIDLLYVTSHGSFNPPDYRVVLQDRDWLPFATALTNAPSVVVFDTCSLLDSDDRAQSQNAVAQWQRKVGPRPRIVLGFATPAGMDKDSTNRGRAFAGNLAGGVPIKRAWFDAVRTTSTSRTEVPVAIAFSSTVADAKRLLQDARLMDLPLAPVPGASSFIEYG